MKKIAQRVLSLLGWKIIEPPKGLPDKSVICVAPHTSNHDFFLGKLYSWATSYTSGFLMKKEWFFFPLGIILKAMGGIPIDRSRRGSTVEEVKMFFKKPGSRHIAITPEGTRRLGEKWHTGFYYIATGANVPILLAVIDYKKKGIGVFEIFYPTGDLEADIDYIRSKYNRSQAKFPEKFYEKK